MSNVSLASVLNGPYALLSLIVFSDRDDLNFGEMSVLLFGGLILVAVLAIVLTLIKVRVQGKRGPSSRYISIDPSKQKK